MLHRVEARIGRVGLYVLLFVVGWLTVMVPVGVLGSSNLVWGEGNQYGRVDIPGSKVLHLPARTIKANVAVGLPGRGNETPNLPLPRNLSLTVTAVGGSGSATVTKHIGDSENANADNVDTQRPVWRVNVSQDGDYRVTARGSFLAIGVNPQVWFGHGPPLPGVLVPLVAALIVLVLGLVWFFVLPRLPGRRGHRPRASSVASEPPDERFAAPAPRSDSVERLARLAELHDRGALTDEEFAAEKANVIDTG